MNGLHGPRIPDYLAVGIVSAAGLAYEILLLRVFSYSQWHHFASLAVSLALLGFGAAGTTLTLLGKRVIRWGDSLFIGGMLVGASGMLFAFILSGNMPVRPLFAVWDAEELGKLLLVDFASFIPFFGIGLCAGMVFMRWPEATPRLYAANLLGSGAGAIGAVLLTGTLFLETALVTVPLVLLLGAALHGIGRAGTRSAGVLSLAFAVALATWIWAGIPSLPVSDFKRLAYLLDLPDARVIAREPGMRAQATIVRSDSIRVSPGLSLNWPQSLPAQDALVLDSDRVIPLPREYPPGGAWPHFRATLGALPFLLRPEGAAAFLGTSDWLPPALPGERPVHWVESNALVIESFKERGWPPSITIHRTDPRSFLSSGSSQFSVLFLATGTDPQDAIGEDYRLTVESIRQALRRLEPGGILALPFLLQNPPRYGPKLLAMSAEALKKEGKDSPEQHVALLRSMREGLLLLSACPFAYSTEKRTCPHGGGVYSSACPYGGENGACPHGDDSRKSGVCPYGESDLTAIRRFSEEWGFDLAALPGLRPEEANLYHLLDQPLYYLSAKAIFGGEAPLPPDASWYTLAPAHDLQPYFWRTMKWRNLPELIDRLGRQGLVWLDWALLATVAKLLVVFVLAVCLVLLPLGRLPPARPPHSRRDILLYFGALGLGYLLLEMAIFQRAILYLGHPVTAASVVFAVFLISSGIGSLGAPTAAKPGRDRDIFLPILAFALLASVILVPGKPLLLSLPQVLRGLAVGVASAPLAWAMGRAMPWGLRQLDSLRDFIPWAWGVNGFASVLAAPLAALLSVHFGQPATWLAALICYLVAWRIASAWIAGNRTSAS